ncbi:MAG TPA: trypsin-like peptidase domain-containing protein [Thermoguttaceae bacterium]|nr:trypsin-like peptidase domain-containing protein [Thermoguttaceae bacterium]
MVSFSTALLALALLSGAQGQGETVLLDFGADWCMPCRQMDPAVKELMARGYPVQKVNVDRNPELAAKYGVDRLPSFMMLVDGQVVDRVVGGTTFSRLERMCKLGRDSRSSPPPGVQRAASDTRNPASAPIPPVGTDPVSPNAGRDLVFPVATEQQPAARPIDSQATSPASPGPWRLASTDSATRADATRSYADRLIAATVRLRIEDPDGHSCGSGTIIDAQDGEALILTCGHIFRDSKGRGPIEVDLFGPTPAERVPGRLLSYDLERDIAILTIRTPGPVATARVAPAGYRVAKDDRVITVGCNNGEPPSARFSRVTSVDKYLGPPNLEVAGLPVQGRSGGGLFSQDGLVIGVCNAADPADDEGLYTALAAVQAELGEAGLAFVYHAGGSSATEAPLVALNPPPVPKQMPRPGDPNREADVPTNSLGCLADRGQPNRISPLDRSQQVQDLSGEELAALEEIQERREQGAEVICVVRSRSDPRAPSEIIVLDRVSPAFLEQLAAQSRTQRQTTRHLTSLEVPETGQKRRPAEPLPPPSPRTLLEYRSDVR